MPKSKTYSRHDLRQHLEQRKVLLNPYIASQDEFVVGMLKASEKRVFIKNAVLFSILALVMLISGLGKYSDAQVGSITLAVITFFLT